MTGRQNQDIPPEAADDSPEQQHSPPPALTLDEPPEAAAAPASVARGADIIRQIWRKLPSRPGVYRMIGEGGEVLYVGKARSLKKRVASYTRGQGHGNRIARMIAATQSMTFVTTGTETEALLLETNYIKQLKPRFNVLMRDDKSFPYILITADHAAPQIAKHRGARGRPGEYYGPFANAGAVGRTINTLQRAFLLRSCSDSYYENRSRPCLLFQIKRCAAPCTGEISAADYAGLVDQAKDFLTGRSQSVKQRLSAEMQDASAALEFERAARCRDRLAALSAIQSSQDINPRETEEADVFAIAEQAGQFCVEVFFFRTFQNWGNRAYFPKADRSLTPAEVLDAFLTQFYDDKPCPKLILLSHETENMALMAEAFSFRAGRKIEIAMPKRGEKHDLVQHAASNAHEELARRLSDTASQAKLLAALGETFGVSAPIRRVEVFDNSHIMGASAAGAMIVAGVQGFVKTQYRIFNFKSADTAPGDDYAMMREMLTRRFARVAAERAAAAAVANAEQSHSENCPSSPAGPSPRFHGEKEDAAAPPLPFSPQAGRLRREAPKGEGPDEGQNHQNAIALATNTPAPGSDSEFPTVPGLVLIDGGKGQLEAARAVFAELGISDIPLVGIAKGPDRNAGRETFFTEGRQPFRLAPRDPALYFVQRLRDEAHRFAIGAHRAKRKRDLTRNPLDEIAGIGPSRKRALLLHFGTAKAVSQAGLDDLKRISGINAATARLVYDFFQKP